MCRRLCPRMAWPTGNAAFLSENPNGHQLVLKAVMADHQQSSRVSVSLRPCQHKLSPSRVLGLGAQGMIASVKIAGVRWAGDAETCDDGHSWRHDWSVESKADSGMAVNGRGKPDRSCPVGSPTVSEGRRVPVQAQTQTGTATDSGRYLRGRHRATCGQWRGEGSPSQRVACGYCFGARQDSVNQ